LITTIRGWERGGGEKKGKGIIGGGGMTGCYLKFKGPTKKKRKKNFGGFRPGGWVQKWQRGGGLGYGACSNGNGEKSELKRGTTTRSEGSKIIELDLVGNVQANGTGAKRKPLHYRTHQKKTTRSDWVCDEKGIQGMPKGTRKLTNYSDGEVKTPERTRHRAESGTFQTVEGCGESN